MTATSGDVERLEKQNAMLMRALMRVKQERDALAKQIAARDEERCLKSLPSYGPNDDGDLPDCDCCACQSQAVPR